MKRCMTKWRKLSPSAQVIVDPVSSARGIIRDTRVEGAYRFHWSVIPADEPLPIAGALGIYAEDWLELVGAYTEAVTTRERRFLDGRPPSYAVSR